MLNRVNKHRDRARVCPADDTPDSTRAVAGSDHRSSGHNRPVQVHGEQLHAHCDLQDSILLLLSACGLWHANGRHQPASCLPDCQGDPADHGAVLSGMPPLAAVMCIRLATLSVFEKGNPKAICSNYPTSVCSDSNRKTIFIFWVDWEVGVTVQYPAC